MGTAFKSLDILRVSVTFLAFATVVFILTTSWAVLHPRGDRASCQSLLESAREIKDSLQKLGVNQKQLLNDLQDVQGQKSELLRAILSADIDGPRLSHSAQTSLNFNDDRKDQEARINFDHVDGTSNNEKLDFTHPGWKLKICIFGRPDLPSRTVREVHCQRLNSTVEVVHSLSATDVGNADVTLFVDTNQKYGFWATLLKGRNPQQRWGLLSMVPPTSSAKYTSVPKAFKAETFHWTVNYNYKSDVPLPFGRYTEGESSGVDENHLSLFDKTKFIAYIASDCDEEKWPRSRFVAELKSFVGVQVFGCDPCGPDCQKELKEFKFILALESTPCRGYITEVFWAALAVYKSVPIVWGAQPDDYLRVAPNNSFIDIRNFESIRSLGNYITNLGQSPSDYQSFHAWRETVKAEVLVHMSERNDVPQDHHVCTAAQKYLDKYNKKTPFRETNRDDWMGTCDIRPNEVVERLPIPVETDET